jgi:hypothetical protein
MVPTFESCNSETLAVASALSIKHKLLADIDQSINYGNVENPMDPFSTKQFQSK